MTHLTRFSSSKRGAWRFVIVGVWATVWGLLVAAGCPPPNSPSVYGVGGDSGNNVPNAYAHAREAGLEWVRIFLPMNVIMPSSGVCANGTAPPCWDDPYGPPAWAPCGSSLSAGQRIMEAFSYRRSIIAVLDGNALPAGPEYQTFAYLAAKRWVGQVATWELWNEPDVAG